MYLLRYEKDSLKDYIVYDIIDDELFKIINNDNGFQMCYLNNDSDNIRVYFKVLFFNKDIKNVLDKILIFINEKFKSTNSSWTILSNERMIDNDHVVTLYFFSDKYYMTLKNLKKYIDDLYFSDIIFDISIYYTFNSKYRELITIPLPNQSNQYFKYAAKFKIFSGSPNNLIVSNIQNLVEL